MAWRNSLEIAVLASLIFAGAATSAAAEDRGSAMKLGEQAPPPRAYIDFCFRQPGECPPSIKAAAPGAGARASTSEYWRLVFDTAGPGAIEAAKTPRRAAQGEPADSGPADKDVWRRLNAVNKTVNEHIRQRTDIEHYGVSDYWSMPLEAGGDRQGDCEDFVLEKRHALLNEGFSANDLSIALVKTAWNQSHAVLLVKTPQGEVVLDNLSHWIVRWQEVSYTWLMRQDPENPGAWVRVNEQRAPA